MNYLSFSNNLLIGIGSTLVLGMTFILISSCDLGPPKGSLYQQAIEGQKHFNLYCSSCHGEDARGLQIDSLDTQPPNLRKIMSNRRNKEFPIKEIARMIDGRQMVEAHGPRSMPVWGEVFASEENLNQKQIQGKLGEIIAYLKSIQVE